MTNYKPIHDAIFNRAVSNLVKPITLHGLTATTAGQSLHNMSNADYVVPTGKRFHIVSVKYQGGTASRTTTIYESTGADGILDKEDICTFQSMSASLETELHILDPIKEVDTGSYINWLVSNAGNAPILRAVYGFEINEP